MPNDANPAADHSLKIAGLHFSLSRPIPFHTGHVLTEAEASVLNQTWVENLRNNFAAKVKAAVDAIPAEEKTNGIPEGLLTALQTEFNTYASTYTFGIRAPKAHVDPIEHLAQKIAKEAISTRLRERKIDIKSISAEKMQEYITSYLAKYPDARKEAKRRLDAMRKAVAADLDDLGL